MPLRQFALGARLGVFDRRDELDAVVEALQQFVNADGSVTEPATTWIVTATNPG